MTAKTIRIGLVLTGGPVGSTKRNELLLIDLTESSVDNEIQAFVKSWRGPERLDLHTRTPLQKPSEWMTPSDWLKIAETTRDLVAESGAKSIVILHGTDTAAFTTAALSFLLNDLDAAVVVTGANLPMHHLESDAPTNIADAISASRSLPSGVYLSFAGVAGAASYVHRGTTVRKIQAGGQGFDSPNHGPVAKVLNGVVTLIDESVERAGIRCRHEVCTDITYVPMVPGIDLEMMADALASSGKRGVMLKLYTTATGPENGERDSIRKFVRRCNEDGMVVVTAIPQYSSESGLYLSGFAAQEEGAVFAEDMIPETAYVKLCWALAQRESRDEAIALFKTSIAGESRVLGSHSEL